jgi:predicted Zn-dependent protease with MMP-like domain
MLAAMAVAVTTERFEELVGEALDSIPDELAGYMENVAVVVQAWPTTRQQSGHPGMLLGLYEGVDLTRRGPLSYSAVLPDRITIFQGPHCRITSSVEELRRRIATTVIHEVGHHFGLGDERLRRLGWA